MHKNKLFYENTIEIKGKFIGAEQPLVMGIVNITPDSFFDGSRKQTENEILSTVAKMLEDGVDIIDLGAYSSRPNAKHVTEDEEWQRLQPVVGKISRQFPNTILSIDTFRVAVAKKCIGEGADVINDISAGNLDPKMFEFIALANCPYIMMHMKGNPQNMQTLCDYENIIEEVKKYFEEKITELAASKFSKIIIDPGFGFAKNTEQNFELLAKADEFNTLQRPMLIGISRKSMIYNTLNIKADDALNGSTALNMVALEKGAKLLRVHDVKEAVECVKLWKKLNQHS